MNKHKFEFTEQYLVKAANRPETALNNLRRHIAPNGTVKQKTLTIFHAGDVVKETVFSLNDNGNYYSTHGEELTKTLIDRKKLHDKQPRHKLSIQIR